MIGRVEIEFNQAEIIKKDNVEKSTIKEIMKIENTDEYI
jgi:hypothetical protein